MEAPGEHDSVRPKNPQVFGPERKFVAYYRGSEVYCRECLPLSEDGDEFERMWTDLDGGGLEIESLPVCLVCGREFPEYFSRDAYENAFAILEAFNREFE